MDVDEQTLHKVKRDAEVDNWEIAPDGSSAGRSGRHFAVANVGNNGRIFLKPTVRPAHERYPQPKFTFPVTPPGTAGLDTFSNARSALDVDSDLHQSQWTPTPRPSPAMDGPLDMPLSKPDTRPIRHRRALSDSTIHEFTPNESDAGAFRIVISKPGDPSRPKTTEESNGKALPHLEIAIPSWRIGTPRFTATGTPLIRGSSYAPSFAQSGPQSDEPQSARASVFDRSYSDVNFPLPPLGPRRPSTLQIPQAQFSRQTTRRSTGLVPPKASNPLRATFMSARTVIDAPMYDELTFKPACDDRTIVRYSPTSGAVTAATPPRLVAEITSPSFLDYELISDFFLTYRAFLEPDALVRMLVARLRWAAARNDGTGMIVHVRAFVALRHWILNYFMGDFVVDYDLRRLFCELLNELVHDLLQQAPTYQVQLKTLDELKKCWRRVCSHYWDGPEFDDGAAIDSPILPGGVAGHRDSSLDPTFWEQRYTAPPQSTRLMPVSENAASDFRPELSRPGHIGDSIVIARRPTTPENAQSTTHDRDFGPWSPQSLASLDIISCSFPNKFTRGPQPHVNHSLGAHPVSTSSVYDQSGPVATTPRALVGKRVRPNHQQHQRSNSLPESPADNEPSHFTYKDHDFTMATSHAGSLVRGDMMPPGKAFVEVARWDSGRHTTIFEHEDFDERLLMPDAQADAMSSRGMKRLLGSVRRALSTRAPGNGISPDHLPIRAATASATNRLPGTAIVPQKPISRDGARPPVRIDLLGAEVAQDFKRAVREDAAAEAENRDHRMGPTLEEEEEEEEGEDKPIYLGYSPGDLETGPPQNPQQQPPHQLPRESVLSCGSQSILIVDDTVSATGRSDNYTTIPPSERSIEDFGDTLMPKMSNITPPITPPAGQSDMARRSSHVVNHNMRTAMAPDVPLPAVPDSSLMKDPSSTPGSEEGCYQPPSTVRARSHRLPPLSGGMSKIHRRDQSSKTHQSLNSVLHHRNGSLSSDIIPTSHIRSFDATSYTRYSVDEDEEEPDVPVPKPLRMLRRRPGGDLRAATNVDDLDKRMLRRSRSLGSITALSESFCGSIGNRNRPRSAERVGSVKSSEYPIRTQVFSVGQLADNPRKRQVSLCSTRSSKPPMRSSFEADAKKLAEIPDDEDDGGVESALAKLEGKFEKRLTPPKLSMDLSDRDDALSETSSVDFSETWTDIHRQASTAEEEQSGTPPPGLRPRNRRLDLPAAAAEVNRQSFLSDATRESYLSVPLLDRGLTDDDGQSERTTRNWTDRSILQDEDDASPLAIVASPDGSHLSFEFIQQTEAAMESKTALSLPPRNSTGDETFLDSDLSSEISEEYTPKKQPGLHHASSPTRGFPAHPLGERNIATQGGLSSPSNTGDGSMEEPPHDNGSRASAQRDLTLKPLPPTPDATPGIAMGPRSPFDQIGTDHPPFDASGQEADACRKYSVHLPFILAFDSDTLAQQFTLIEKDALNEIDWKELVDMDWKNAANDNPSSWVEFLRNTDAQGVQVVIARFNLMVKWAVSEIVLTQHIEERARCLIKYIHIAAHCRRYRNFATLAQLTIALSSNEVSRLARTWELVPPSDLQTLKDLEALVTPTRNFFDLRAEMESGPNIGCIPFVVIYTRDLIYNAQRPSEIASSPTTPPLVNFERCRISAGVVKTLLRLLEASTYYDFHPIEGVTERCLWIGALTEEEIRRHSGNLE
ncbi:Guanine nucleotide exchange factor-like protein [Emericellopsis cladophorae]|uniref:Guanine nucleotide exchange factor-like protein n=1 Tax=Emericellopsis cladophorae TaxID=2686198 RepID=A0A9P9Y674_9HYPO|nr:Guanine nucleotide exchange factor-like protein [Emericellopsis cladophorae]KAI6784318.1 Guanine nucleotide exchange factor-like protein [Emericellopsis cladophorae]